MIGTSPISGSDIVKAVGAPIMAAASAALAWLTTGTSLGPALAALLSGVAVVCGIAFTLYYGRTVGVLGAGAEPEGSPERRAYDRLRASLAEGNLPERLYATWLKKFLDWVEQFFGDRGMADRTLFPHAFGLKTTAPLWTAPAFDRCLLLALIYPMATIFIIWAISGHVGPTEAALGLKPNTTSWARALGAVSAGFFTFAFGRLVRAPRLPSLERVPWTMCSCIGVGIFFVTSTASDATSFTTLFALLTVGGVIGAAVFGSGAELSTGASAVTTATAFVVALCFAHFSGIYFLGGILLGLVGSAIIDLIHEQAINIRQQGIFLAFWLAAMVLFCWTSASLFSHLEGWKNSSPLWLFVGLLTLLNAPFDWASLGLTRALLRRGLELKGWWPYFLAFVDAALAGVVIALLALTMVMGVQAFDELAVRGGGPSAAVLPLSVLFNGIAKDPAAPEYWWLYALLLSTMIPSLVNLVIGGMALTRGIPGLGRLLLNFMPVGKAVPAFDRAWIAAVLSVQVFGGIFFGIAAQFLLAWGLLYHLMPLVGLNLLDMARAVANFDVPARIGALFTGSS